MNEPVLVADKDSALIEQLARQLLLDAGADPDEVVQAGIPQTRGTPQGAYFVVNPLAAVPLWRTFISTARMFLAAADKVRGEAEQKAVDSAPLPSIVEAAE